MGVKQGMLCALTIFVVVSTVTVEAHLPIVELVAKASVHLLLLLLLLPQVLDQEWVTYSPTPCSIPSFPIGTPSTPMLRSSPLPMLTLLLVPRGAPFK